MAENFIEEAHMANGRWGMSVDFDPELLDLMTDDQGRPLPLHLFRYEPDGTTLTDILVLMDITPSEKEILLEGPSLAWWLHPLIRERLYVSDQQRLRNGDFESNVWGEPIEHWSVSGDTKWVAGVGAGHAGSAGAAYVGSDPDADDALVAEPIEPAVAGEQYYIQLHLIRATGATGHISPRIVFTGKFVHPNLCPPYSDWDATVPPGRGDIVLGTDPTGAIAGPTLNIRTAVPNLIANGSFDDSGGTLNGYIPIAGTWLLGNDGGHNGTYYMHTDGGPAWKEILNSKDGAIVLPQVPQPVVEGKEYTFWAVARTNPGSPTTDGTVKMMVGMTGGTAADDYIESNKISADNGADTWRLLGPVTITVDAGRTAATPQIVVEGQTQGRWDIDDVTFICTKGNTDSWDSPVILGLVPERTYLWRVPYRADLSVMGGRAQLQAVVGGAHRPLQLVTGPELRQPSDDPNIQYAEFAITPPSGYTGVILRTFSEDVIGGSICVGQGTLIDQDTGSVVFAGQSPETYATWTANALDPVTAPAGTTGVHAEVVAEAGAGGWLVDDVLFIRFGVTALTIAQIVVDLLLDPDTGAGLSVIPGTIIGPDHLLADWRLRDFTIGDALAHLCRVLAVPQFEWRINSPTRTIDVGPPEDIFADHFPDDDDPGLVFLASDVEVTDVSALHQSSANLASKVLLIGAERTTTTGLTSTIEVVAPVVTDRVDFNGNPVNRTIVVEDPTVANATYGAALAADHAARNAQPAQEVTVSLSGAENRGAPPGDWVYPYKPESGLTDAANECVVAGATVWPARKRVLSRKRTFGTGVVKLRLANGTLEPLDVKWDAAGDTTTLDLGDFVQPFEADPDGDDIARQYLRRVASTPR